MLTPEEQWKLSSTIQKKLQDVFNSIYIHDMEYKGNCDDVKRIVEKELDNLGVRYEFVPEYSRTDRTKASYIVEQIDKDLNSGETYSNYDSKVRKYCLGLHYKLLDCDLYPLFIWIHAIREFRQEHNKKNFIYDSLVPTSHNLDYNYYDHDHLRNYTFDNYFYL